MRLTLIAIIAVCAGSAARADKSVCAGQACSCNKSTQMLDGSASSDQYAAAGVFASAQRRDVTSKLKPKQQLWTLTRRCVANDYDHFAHAYGIEKVREIRAKLQSNIVLMKHEWKSDAVDSSVSLNGVADDGLSHFNLTCTSDTRSLGFNFDADGYHGHALKKVLDLEQRFFVEFRTESGPIRKFSVLAYFDGDGDWTQEDKQNLTGGDATAFLDAFAQDGHLSLQNGTGVEVANWTLRGTSTMRERMRKICSI